MIELRPDERAVYDLWEHEFAEVWKLLRLKEADYSSVFVALMKMRLAAIAPALLNTEAIRDELDSKRRAKAEIKKRESSNEDNDDDEDEVKERNNTEAKAEEDLANLQLSPADLVNAIRGPGGIGATKPQATIRIIEEFTDHGNNGRKMLVFSHFATVLQLLKAALIETCTDVQEDRITIFHLDGSVKKMDDRNDILDDFRNHEGSAVLLITSQLGGEGWTATHATGAIKMEPDWTPANREQQKHRFWRIGQTQEVHWFELFVNDSIESFVYMVNTYKLKVDKFTTSRTRWANGKTLNNRETLTLFLSERKKRIMAAAPPPPPPPPVLVPRPTRVLMPEKLVQTQLVLHFGLPLPLPPGPPWAPSSPHTALVNPQTLIILDEDDEEEEDEIDSEEEEDIIKEEDRYSKLAKMEEILEDRMEVTTTTVNTSPEAEAGKLWLDIEGNDPLKPSIVMDEDEYWTGLGL